MSLRIGGTWGVLSGRSTSPPIEGAETRRVVAARRVSAWTELDPSALTKPNRRFLVHTSTDEVFTPYAGACWNELGGIAFAETNPLYFTVEDGDVRLFEKYPRTWSEITQAGAR